MTSKKTAPAGGTKAKAGAKTAKAAKAAKPAKKAPAKKAAAKSGMATDSTSEASSSSTPASSGASRAAEGLPIKMMNDRILVRLSEDEGERRTGGGILIPATAQVGKRLAWAEVVAAGPSARTMELGDRVLFNPEDRYEVELHGSEYIILRERDIHAVAAPRLEDSGHGLYL